MSGGRSKSVRERLAASIRRTPKQAVEINYGNIVVLGSEKVGKTSIVSRFVNNYFTANYVPTTDQQMYEVISLIECEKDKEAESKKMVMKKSFKKSIMGKSRPLKPRTTMKRVLTVNKSNNGENSTAFKEGQEKGLRQLKFNIVDTPPDMPENQRMAYEATLANAKGFFLVCSFDIKDSLAYIEERFADIKKIRDMDQTPILLIANKNDLENKEWKEEHINLLAAKLHTKYCVASVAEKDGCVHLHEVMLNEINYFAEEELYQASLPEDYAYYDENDERDIGLF